jgi:hypothetical protein
LLDDEPPKISIAEFPGGERQAISHIGMLLLNLELYIVNFDAAMSLSYFSSGCIGMLSSGNAKIIAMVPQKDPQLYMQWATIAGRDGAMTIYHFAKTLEAIRKFAFLDCPTFKARVDHQHLRIAQKLFAQWFPDFLHVRHAVAHSAELMKNLKSKQRHASGGTWTIRDMYSGTKFINTFDGRECTYDMSVKTLSHLKKVQDACYIPFLTFDLIHHRLIRSKINQA